MPMSLNHINHFWEFLYFILESMRSLQKWSACDKINKKCTNKYFMHKMQKTRIKENSNPLTLRLCFFSVLNNFALMLKYDIIEMDDVQKNNKRNKIYFEVTKHLLYWLSVLVSAPKWNSHVDQINFINKKK
jgi:hypothetical protein